MEYLYSVTLHCDQKITVSSFLVYYIDHQLVGMLTLFLGNVALASVFELYTTYMNMKCLFKIAFIIIFIS